MANPLDTDAGSELFSNYEAELKLVQADLNQKLDQAEELSGEEKKTAIRGAQRALDEAKELVCNTTFYTTFPIVPQSYPIASHPMPSIYPPFASLLFPLHISFVCFSAANATCFISNSSTNSTSKKQTSPHQPAQKRTNGIATPKPTSTRSHGV